MGTRVRVLGNADLPAAMDLLAPDPITNLFFRSRIATAGLDRVMLGCEVLGVERGRELVAMMHNGSNLVPAGDPEALRLIAPRLGRRRHTSSIMGQADLATQLLDQLVQLHGGSWGAVRELRAHQPLMVTRDAAQLDGDRRVRQITMADFAPYFEAAVKMYTEEVGVSPLDPSGGYATHVRRIIQAGHAFGIIEDGSVSFKADVGTALGDICQIQGVWLHPKLRGRGLSHAPMASVIDLCLQRYRVVSLYVNDFNTRARRLYERLGMRTEGELATVLY